MPDRGLGWTVLHYLARDRPLGNALAKLPEADLAFNFVGSLLSEESSEELSVVAGLPAGERSNVSLVDGRNRPFKLAMAVYVGGGQLLTKLMPPPGVYSRGVLLGLRDEILHRLAQI
jgi:hypothetical protein